MNENMFCFCAEIENFECKSSEMIKSQINN